VSRDGFFPTPPCAESPFAHGWCYLPWRGALLHIGRHYPSFIAHTGSWARPKPSRRLRFNYYDGSLQVVVSPCWPPAHRAYGSERSRSFPSLSLQSLRRCLDPYPAMSFRCTCSLLPGRQRPHLRRHRFGTPDYRRNATSMTGEFRGCSHSLMFRLPRSLDPQVAPTASQKDDGQPGRLHHA